MRIGICSGLENFALARRLGFDYFELTIFAVASLSDAEYEKARAMIKTGTLPAERANGMFPSAMKLIGPEADQKSIDGYLEKAFARVSGMGVDTVVFGSGTPRAFPGGISFERGYRELIAFTKRAGEIAAKYGITFCIEPLNRSETNCLNSIKEASMLEAAVDSPNVGIIADLYHILKDNEGFDSVVSAKSIRHTHIALLEGRGYPVRVTPEVRSFFDALHKTGYDGTMSIEGKTGNMEEDAALSLAALRSLC